MNTRWLVVAVLLGTLMTGTVAAQVNVDQRTLRGANLDQSQLQDVQFNIDPSMLQAIQSSFEASPVLSDAAKHFLADIVVEPSRPESDYVISVPLELSGLNWRVDKVIVTCYVWDGNQETGSLGSGSLELDVPSNGAIHEEVAVPVFWDEEATNMPTTYQCIPMLSAGEETLPAGYSDTNNAGTDSTAPYWAQVDESGQNSWITVEYSFWGFSGTERFIGVEGELN